MIKVSNLTKRYSGRTAVDDISFTVARGEIVGLLGPNGAGKTTLIRMVLGLIPPDAGTVELLGASPGVGPRDRIGYLPEERGLYRKGRLDETLEYLMRLRGLTPEAARTRVASALEEMGLAAWSRRRVADLSKGMAQRVQFIVASGHQPAFMVLDEPFSGLDPVGVQWALQQIQGYRERGATILLSAHQMDMVQRICDRVVMVHRGHRVLYGTFAEIRADWPTDHARLGCAEDLASRPALADLAPRRRGRTEWEVALGGADPAAVLRRLVESGVAVAWFAPVQATLEDVFLDVVQGEPELPPREPAA